MKKLLTIAVVLAACLALTVPALACPPEQDCADNVESHVSGSFGAYDSAGFNRDTGTRGASAFADGYGAGSFEANSYGDRFAHTSGFGLGHVDPVVGAAGGSNWAASGALVSAGSVAGAFAANDGGVRDAFAETHGSVYQNNSAYITDGPGNFASGGNESGANYANSNSESYTGSRNTSIQYVGPPGGGFLGLGYLNPRNYERVTTFECLPGFVDAFSAGGATAGGGTFVHSQNNGNSATSFGATGSFSIGNDGVFGGGFMETGTFVSNGNSGASAYTSGSYNYSGNGVGAGATYGGSHAQIGNGTVSVRAHHTSVATGNSGGQPD